MPKVRRARFHKESLPSLRRRVGGCGELVGSVSDWFDGDGPDIVFVDVVFSISRFVMLDVNNQSLYIF